MRRRQSRSVARVAARWRAVAAPRARSGTTAALRQIVMPPLMPFLLQRPLAGACGRCERFWTLPRCSAHSITSSMLALGEVLAQAAAARSPQRRYLVTNQRFCDGQHIHAHRKVALIG